MRVQVLLGWDWPDLQQWRACSELIRGRVHGATPANEGFVTFDSQTLTGAPAWQLDYESGT